MTALLSIIGLNIVFFAWIIYMVVKDPANVWRGKPRPKKEKRQRRLPGQNS